MIYYFIGIAYSNENEWTRAMYNMGKSQEHVKQRKEVVEEYLQWFHL